VKHPCDFRWEFEAAVLLGGIDWLKRPFLVIQMVSFSVYWFVRVFGYIFLGNRVTKVSLMFLIYANIKFVLKHFE